MAKRRFFDLNLDHRSVKTTPDAQAAGRDDNQGDRGEHADIAGNARGNQYTRPLNAHDPATDYQAAHPSPLAGVWT